MSSSVFFFVLFLNRSFILAKTENDSPNVFNDKQADDPRIWGNESEYVTKCQWENKTGYKMCSWHVLEISFALSAHCAILSAGTWLLAQAVMKWSLKY